MRILIVSAGIPFPPIGGGLTRTFHLTKALAQRHEVTLVGFTYDDETCSPAIPVRVVSVPWQWPTLYEKMLLGDDETAADASAMLDRGLDEPWLVSFYDCQAMETAIARLIDEGTDLVLFEGTDMARFLPCLPPDTPAVVDFMDVHSLMTLRKARNEVGEERIRADREANRVVAFEKRIADQSALCLACSDAEAQAVRTLLGVNHVTVVPNGVDTSYFTPSNHPETEGSLLFTGLMSYEPNIEAVIHFVETVFPTIQRQLPSATFHITGSQPPQSVQGLASSEVKVHGRVPDMRPYFRDAAVVVVPLLRGGGTRLKILEAAASGKAIVTTSVGVEGLNFRSGESLLVADSIEQFADAVIHLATDTNARRRIGRLARATAVQYDWETIGNRLCGAIEELAMRAVVAR